jgi:hypothetical protein
MCCAAHFPTLSDPRVVRPFSPMLHPRLSVVPAVARLVPLLLTLGACFSPSLPSQVACGENGACPPGLRCEAIANICVSNDQAAVDELAYTAQPADVEATRTAPAVTIELRNADGAKVPLSGGTFAVEVAANDAGVKLSGSVIASAEAGLVTFDGLEFDRPGRGLRIIVHGGDLAATSAPFDVGITKPAVLGISVGSVVDSCTTVTYKLQQAQSLPVDLLVEFDPDGPEGPLPYRRASQAGSAPGKAGVDGVPGSPEGRLLTFTWDTSADVPGIDAAGRLRITPSIRGVVGTPFEGPVTVRNGPRFYAFGHDLTSSGIRHFLDGDHDGLFRQSTANLENRTISVEAMDDYAIPADALVNDYGIGDFNGDGRMDLVVALSTGTVTQLQLRAGGGHMGPSESVGGTYGQVVTDDLDHDGRADVIAVEEGTGDVVVLRASTPSSATLVESARPWHGGDTAAVHLADLDHDGWKDLVIARSSPTGPVAVVRGSAAGFAAPTNLDGLVGGVVDVADLDFDGRDDVASLDADGLHVAASTAGRIDVPAITGSVLAIHDLNNDRLPDVVVAKQDGLYVYSHAPARHGVEFEPAAFVGTVPGTTSLVIGAFDGEDRPDLYVLADDPSETGKLYQFRNTRPRRCAPRLNSPPSTGPYMSMGSVIGEVNGDGKVDVIGFIGGLGRHLQVVAALGRGDGTFEAADGPLYDLAENVQAHALVVTDVDGDGMDDVAFASFDAREVTILFNERGSPGVYTPVVLPVQSPTGLAIADLDGDGAKELVILDGGQVQIRSADRLNPRAFGAPTILPDRFAPGDASAVCQYGCDARVVDADADGHLDIVVGTDVDLSCFRADARAPVGYAAPVTAVTAARWSFGAMDVNENGRPEILLNVPATPSSPASLAGFELDQSGTALTPAWSIPIGNVSSVVSIDVDGDGHEDTLVEDEDLAWVLEHGAQPEVRDLHWGHMRDGAYSFGVADVNSDGHEDLIALGYDQATIRFDEHGPIDLPVRLTSQGVGDQGTFGNVLAVGDFNGDDLPDLAIRDSAAGQVILRAQSEAAPGTLAPEQTAVTGWYSSALADVDGDRRADLVTYGDNDSLFYLDPTAPTSHGLCANSFPSYPYAVGDVDHDGRPDIVETTWTDVVLRRDPADSCAAPVVVMALDADPALSWRPQKVKLADLNHDGFLDVVIATDAVRVALQDPDAPGSFSVTDYEAQSRSDRPTYFDFEIAQIDSDSELDIVVLDADGNIRELEGDQFTRGTFRPSTLLSANDHYYSRASLSVGDINDDGHSDIVVGGAFENEVLLQESDPDYPFDSGPFDRAYLTPGANVDQYDAERATIVDFDGDGRNDVVYVDPAQGTMLLRGR